MRKISEQELLELLGKPLSEEQKQEIAALQEKEDEDIDLSDIPEVDFSKVGFSYRGPIVQLRKDLREYFCALAIRRRVPMNDLVNEALAKAVELAKVVELARPVDEPGKAEPAA